MDESLKVAMIPAVASIIVVIIATLWQNKKLETIHILVNSQLQKALDRIAVLEGVIRSIKEIRTTHEVEAMQDIDERGQPPVT